VAWVLSYVQGGIAEAWKDNLLDELAKGELEVESAEQLFTKIRNDFGETSEKERKIAMRENPSSKNSREG